MGVLSKVAQSGSAGSTLSLLKPFPRAEDAQHAWRSQDFVAVDDSVRGGISKSSFAVISEQKDAMRSERLPSDAGEAIFSGFLGERTQHCTHTFTCLQTDSICLFVLQTLPSSEELASPRSHSSDLCQSSWMRGTSQDSD